MTTGKGGRARARAQITAEILDAGRRQLATEGAAGLSLRAVARDVGMVSSAVYRYVASRDELLTRLIIEAYDALGATVERAAAGDRHPADRFLAAARAVRAWAVEHPHEFLLLYGSPVPGYAAPADTIGPASRPTLALFGIVTDAHRAGALAPRSPSEAAVASPLRSDLAAVNQALGTDLPDDVLVAATAAWTQMFGLVGFELTGQTRNVVHHHAELFDACVVAMAEMIGLRADSAP
ncbi:MAG: TetR/AcrR family transcriptional regulator [Ilumatobacteraceae bacterium]